MYDAKGTMLEQKIMYKASDHHETDNFKCVF